MTASSLRVLAVGITPPVFKASGGISAGIQLTKRIAKHCETSFAMMSDTDADTIEDGLRIARRKPANLLDPLKSILPRSAHTAMWRPRFFRAMLERERPDIVHIHNPHPPGALTMAAEACKALGIPYVISTHGFVEFNDYTASAGLPVWQRPLMQRLVREPVAKVAREAARVLILSPEETGILTGMGVARERLTVVTNGVDPYFCETPDDAARAALVARFNLPPGRVLALFVGNHTANKGIDVLLKAMALTGGNLTAVIGGAIRSQAEHRALLDGAGVTPGDPRFLFTDFTTKEELRALYQTADIFAFPSYADTLPLVILEAMASGLPVVSTRVGGIPYEVTDETGALVAAGDAAGFARALDLLAADPALRKTKGAAGRARALALFDWDRSAEAAVAVYREILRGR